jgi:hypothetical protein
VEPTSASADSTGIAQTTWTLGIEDGGGTVEARVGGLEPIIFRSLAVPGPPISVTIQPVLRPVVVVDTGVRLIAIVQDSFGNGVNARVDWSTSNPGIARIDSLGLLIGTSFGQVMVQAEVDGVVGDREAWVLERTSVDREDDFDGSQIHFVYAVPSDRADRVIDFDGTLLNAISSIQAWFEEQTSGRQLRVDTRNGLPDVSFVRLSSNDRVIADQRAAAVFAISDELDVAGFVDAGKVYVVFYEGTNSFACGNSAWPPQIPGNVAALYLRARTPRGPCDWPFAAQPNDPMGVWEFILAHEILHLLGFVDPTAPHADGAHVTDHPRDLMVGGRLEDVRAILDFGNDDYYGPNVPVGVRNLADSPFLTP